MASARVTAWALAQARALDRALHARGIDAIDHIAPSPGVAARHRTTVAGVLRRRRATCLVRSALLQRWDADHGRHRPLVVGVARDPGEGVSAHAWLDGEPHAQFEELLRRPPPPARAGSGSGAPDALA